MVTGRPCVDFLDDYSQWKETYSITHILLTIQVTLEISLYFDTQFLLHTPPHFPDKIPVTGKIYQ